MDRDMPQYGATLQVAAVDNCEKPPLHSLRADQGSECNRLWLLKKSRLVQKLPKLGDQKCIRRWRKSFIGHPSASSL